ncbi:MAG: cation acetate symporter, partial [Deltaproteobacteria bacterium]|nr:cation acetate symporter [Deltaproteobacteria bacterium]
MAAIYQNPATILTIVGLMLAFTVASTWIFRAHKVSADYYLPGRRGSHLVNASAISSDYLSAASFLGVAGIAFLEGFDGMVYALGFFVGYLTLLILLAGPLRKFGRYTVPDFVSVRFHSKTARLLGVAGVLSISLFYMAPQMLAAGKILGLVLGLDYRTAIAVVALAITLYVSVGGMKGTTVTQVVQFWILFGSMFLLAFIPWVLHGLTYGQVVASIAAFDAGGVGAFDGSAFVAPGFALIGPVEALSLLLALMCGTAGLPHILERYFT